MVIQNMPYFSIKETMNPNVASAGKWIAKDRSTIS